MLQRVWNVKRGMRAALAAAFAAAFILTCGMRGAIAADDDDTNKDETFEQSILTSIMRGLGADVGDAKIDYHERSPLVVPPNRDLPLPQNAKAVENNPAGPQDP